MYWDEYEVCYWLKSLNLTDYILIFFNNHIDGDILLNDISKDILMTQLNIKSIHCNKIVRQIAQLVCIINICH